MNQNFNFQSERKMQLDKIIAEWQSADTQFQNVDKSIEERIEESKTQLQSLLKDESVTLLYEWFSPSKPQNINLQERKATSAAMYILSQNSITTLELNNLLQGAGYKEVEWSTIELDYPTDVTQVVVLEW